MKKISTLFKKDPANPAHVINEVDPENLWALFVGTPTRKWDGTACAIIEGKLYKRYDAKRGKPAPADGIPCQDPDPVSGHWPHWVPVKEDDPADQYFIEGFKDHIAYRGYPVPGTYELLGPKVQGNPEKVNHALLAPHGGYEVYPPDRTFEGLRKFLEAEDIEGIVFHHPDGRMCKIRKSDFGIKR